MSFIPWESIDGKTFAQKFAYLVDVFRDIADAIKEKGVQTHEVPVQQFGNLIRTIEVGGGTGNLITVVSLPVDSLEGFERIPTYLQGIETRIVTFEEIS